jgi:hypothetical protein
MSGAGMYTSTGSVHGMKAYLDKLDERGMKALSKFKVEHL